MSAAWVVYVLGVGTLLAVAAEVSASACRNLGRSTRFVFAAALAGILALALVAPRPAAVARSVRSNVVTATGPGAYARHAPSLVDQLRDARAMLGRETIALSEAMQRRVPPAAARALLVGWIGASATLFFLFVLVSRRLTNARRGWPSRAMHGIAVRVAPALGPAVLGFHRAEIVVPRSLLERSDEEQRLILAHEREHLCARDHLLLGAAWLFAIAFPWHPAVWYLTNRVRLAIELDCDARVLRGGASPRSYGALLIDMAARQSVVRIGALALVDGPSHLERRIRAMQRKRGRHAVARALLVGATGALFVLAACEAKVPTSAEIASMDVATARHSTEKAGMFRTRADRDVDYFVNGVKTSAEMTNAIDGHSIGSVEIVKSERADGRDTVFVTTVDRMPKGSNSVFGGLPSKMTMGTEQTFERRSQDGSLPRKQLSGQQPTFLIDGRESSVNDVAALPESAIRSVSVFKKTGGSINGEASNGVIAVKTKRRTSKP